MEVDVQIERRAEALKEGDSAARRAEATPLAGKGYETIEVVFVAVKLQEAVGEDAAGGSRWRPWEAIVFVECGSRSLNLCQRCDRGDSRVSSLRIRQAEPFAEGSASVPATFRFTPPIRSRAPGYASMRR